MTAVADLKMTPARVALLRAVRDGNVYTLAGSGRAWLGIIGRGREVTSRVDELRDANLISIPADDADLDLQGYAPTEAGAELLAALDAADTPTT